MFDHAHSGYWLIWSSIDEIDEPGHMVLQNLVSKAREMLRSRKDDIDKGLDKAEQTISERTDGRYDDQVGNLRQKADDALTEDEATSPDSEDDGRDNRSDDTPP